MSKEFFLAYCDRRRIGSVGAFRVDPHPCKLTQVLINRLCIVEIDLSVMKLAYTVIGKAWVRANYKVRD